MFTRGGYFLTDFLNAVTALEDTVNLAIDEYKGGATNESIWERREKEYQEWLLKKQKEEEEKEKQLCQKNQEN